MKRYSEKSVIEELKNGCYIQINILPIELPGVPRIALIGFEDDAKEVLLGSISHPTFCNLKRKNLINKMKWGNSACYDYYA